MLIGGFIILLLLVIFLLVPRRRDVLDQCEGLVAKIDSYGLEGLGGFLSEDTGKEEDVSFWQASSGLRGVWRRWRAMVVTVRIVQIHYEAGCIGASDACQVMRMAILQSWFSLWAVPEAMLAKSFHGLPHIAARAALNIYRDAVMRALNLCITESAPVYIAQLRELL
jgi:hypothetical protein